MGSRILLAPRLAFSKEQRRYIIDGFTDTAWPWICFWQGAEGGICLMGSPIILALDLRLNWLPMLVGRTCPYIAYTFFSTSLVCRSLITQKMLASRITCFSRNNFFA